VKQYRLVSVRSLHKNKTVTGDNEHNVVVGAALTYTPSCCSPISFDLPWAGLVGDDVGGVTCTCVPPARRSTLMIPLLNACVEKLRLQSMKKMFIDGISSDVPVLDGFKSLGMLIQNLFRENPLT
jgi:hypothetical protein